MECGSSNFQVLLAHPGNDILGKEGYGVSLGVEGGGHFFSTRAILSRNAGKNKTNQCFTEYFFIM